MRCGWLQERWEEKRSENCAVVAAHLRWREGLSGIPLAKVPPGEVV